MSNTKKTMTFADAVTFTEDYIVKSLSLPTTRLVSQLRKGLSVKHHVPVPSGMSSNMVTVLFDDGKPHTVNFLRALMSARPALEKRLAAQCTDPIQVKTWMAPERNADGSMDMHMFVEYSMLPAATAPRSAPAAVAPTAASEWSMPAAAAAPVRAAAVSRRAPIASANPFGALDEASDEESSSDEETVSVSGPAPVDSLPETVWASAPKSVMSAESVSPVKARTPPAAPMEMYIQRPAGPVVWADMAEDE